MFEIQKISMIGLLIPMTSGSLIAQPEVIAIENMAVPGITGKFYDSFGSPVIDDVGVVYFKAEWGAAFQDGGFMITENGSTAILLREGVDVAGIPFTVGRFSDVAVSQSGLSSGVAAVTSVRGVNNRYSVLKIDNDGVSLIHYDGDAAPVGFGTAFYRSNMPLSIARDGSVGYSVHLSGTPGGSADDKALFRYNQNNESYSEIVREGDLFPSGDGMFAGSCQSSLRYFCTPLINSRGDSAFISNGGIFVKDESGMHTSVRYGDPVGSGSFDSLSYPKMNGFGQVAFSAEFQGSSSFDGVFIESEGVLNAAPLGGLAPTTMGGFFGAFRTPISTFVQFNDRGEVSFGSQTTEQNAQGNGRVGEGLFVFDGDSVISIARKYEPAPGGGIFDSTYEVGSWMMNDVGQILYHAYIDEDEFTNTNRKTYFLYTPGIGSEKLIATGDEIDGRTVTSITDLESGFAAAGALNIHGEVTLQVRLDSDFDAIVLISDHQPCIADLTGDGVLNFFDVSAFLLGFGANDPISDFTGDGVWNFFDVSAFLLAYSAGCP
mgnify:CR=1 FL=1|tara:strand:+ start:514289 stop:515926 length:1638 start_codon:yes stop_codon:yes gene_type:complete